MLSSRVRVVIFRLKLVVSHASQSNVCPDDANHYQIFLLTRTLR